MREDIDEGVGFLRVVGGGPVSDVFHAVFFEEFGGVVAEAREQGGQLTFNNVIDTEFVDGGVGWHRDRFIG